MTETPEILFGDSVRWPDQDEDGVDVTFEHAPSRRFDLVIGADRLPSPVRRIAFGPDAAFERNLGYCAAAFTVRGYPHRDEAA